MSYTAQYIVGGTSIEFILAAVTAPSLDIYVDPPEIAYLYGPTPPVTPAFAMGVVKAHVIVNKKASMLKIA
jgi:hypothetical protein